MASRFVGLTGLRMGAAAAARPAISTRGMMQVQRRELHASMKRRAADQQKANEKPKRYFQPEIVPLYMIVALAVSAGLYMGTKHLMTDNDLRRAPEYPVDEKGHYDDKPQHRPEWKPVKK